MSIYLISVEAPDGHILEDVQSALKANALKLIKLSAHQLLVQYCGGGAENLAKRIVEMCGPIGGLGIFKLAPDYVLANNTGPADWLDDAARKAAF